MVKPVGSSCNLRCGYCYYSKSQPSGKAASSIMNDDLLERFIRQYIEASPGPAISFTWHGGEPALAGLDFYKKAINIQRKYLPQGWTCWNSLQTNGILLDDEWCSFLADYGFDVGLSIDGTEHLHNLHRRDGGGNGTYRAVESAARRLLSHGIKPDLLCTVTSDTAAEPIAAYRALRRLNSGWIQFIPIVRRVNGTDLSAESVSGQAYGKFLCAVLDEWLLNDIGATDVQIFAETMLVLMGQHTNLCSMAETCGRVLVVECDGGVYSCDHFVTPGHRIGNICSTHIGELIDRTQQQNFGARKHDTLALRCGQCSYLPFCNGGCPKDRFVSTEGEHPLNHLCEGFREFFAHALPALRHVVSMRRQGVAPQSIMAGLRAIAKERWKGVGRNDPCVCGSGKKAKNCCWDWYH